MPTTLEARRWPTRPLVEPADARAGERQRIARELHDTVLQGTQAVILMVRLAVEHMRPGDPARSMLLETLRMADETLAEGRDRIQGLRRPRPAADTWHDALRELGRELERGSTTRFRLEVEPSAIGLDPALADELRIIAREAIVNAFRHAGAGTVTMKARFAPEGLRIDIEDDGTGFNPDAPRRGHWGLVGMRERAAQLGARLAWRARPGGGTRVTLQLSAAAAYR